MKEGHKGAKDSFDNEFMGTKRTYLAGRLFTKTKERKRHFGLVTKIQELKPLATAILTLACVTDSAEL